MNIRIASRIALASLTLVLLAACGKQEQVREVDWAKAALARNPALEIVSTDEASGTFSVRDTTTGATYKLQTNELMAAPLPAKLAQNNVAATPAPAPVATAVPGELAAGPVEAADSQTTDDVAAVRGSGESLVEGPGYSITRGAAQDSVASATNMEGPGYSITREGTATRQSQPDAEAVASGVEKRTDPIVCQGDRLMRIDGETMEFTGDAVIAENGCDLYISNARIRAGGVGIIARQARVHIVNSTIGGSLGSYEASQGAEIYVARSTFAGVGRRFDTATMNDLGGNEYQLHH
jgi:hypothetical protein